MARGRLLVALLAMVWLATTPIPSLSDLGPEFQLGFKTLADLIPETVGDPLEDEHHNPINGDGLQMTTAGLMVWRKADNWTAFTDGWHTWVNGPAGLQERGNDERFDWEVDGTPAAEDDLTPDQSASSIIVLSDTPTPESDATRLAAEETPTQTTDLYPVTSLAATAAAVPTPTVPEAATPVPMPSATADSTSEPTTAPTDSPTVAPLASSTEEPATPTVAPTATAPPSSTPTRTAEPTPAGGVVSEAPAGDWVTSTHATTTYYTVKDDPYWESWALGNRIWFATETALLAAYPDRRRREWNATATPEPTATSTRPAQPTATIAGTATRTPVPGGTISATPAGDWVTSTSGSTKYYCAKESSYWQDWASGNRIWFASETALLAAYPGRVRWETPATSTPVPTATPTRSPQPTSTLVPPTATSTPSQPTATRTPIPGGIISEEPAGDWVTSTYPTTKYYTSRDNKSVWNDWAATNRIWFATEAALLAAYPGRTKK